VTLTGRIPVGGYFLVAGASDVGGGSDPWGPSDFECDLELFSTGGRLALVKHSFSRAAFCNANPSDCPIGEDVADFLGYGAAISAEGNAPAAAPGSQAALFRRGGGCTDTNNNAADFTVEAPNPFFGGGGPTCPWAEGG
jgi:hypothetical protein